MLPDYIINEIKKQEREKACANEWFIECPLPEHDTESIPNTSTPKSEERGVAVIDFTI